MALENGRECFRGEASEHRPLSAVTALSGQTITVNSWIGPSVSRWSRSMPCTWVSPTLVDCEVLVPDALQDVIDERTARQIQARLVVEGANLPTTTAAQGTLATRGVTVIPDLLANAGGIIAAAFARDARYSGFRPESGRVFATVSDKLRANAVAVLEEAQRCTATPH